MHSDDFGQDTLEDIADALLVWFLTDAPGPRDTGTGWANVRVLFPKTNYASRARAIVALKHSGLSFGAIGKLFNLNRSQTCRVYHAETGRTPDD
jgi:hypothetical protein